MRHLRSTSVLIILSGNCCLQLHLRGSLLLLLHLLCCVSGGHLKALADVRRQNRPEAADGAGSHCQGCSDGQHAGQPHGCAAATDHLMFAVA